MKRQKQLKIFICPKCKSSNVRHFFALRNIFGLISKWQCTKCNFEGTIFPQLVIDKSKLEKLNKKIKK